MSAAAHEREIRTRGPPEAFAEALMRGAAESRERRPAGRAAGRRARIEQS
jgi:hypothetical protein